ncbi:hydrogenase maturation nickel metallochaperone HypA [Desulfosporosinus sp.]|uniref:hydrogenase maturation nickel metallochaperone HypA n=1 Tax=Desulfosporosinus sp. TaxID=157907 RepID=UPI00231D1CB8|nr:hydrogenase maturation nickel metallochaperone HypA [Desulfosporosinus sp.]MCO5385165.1 hydrogenase maturation nickel metallochaperone HypA [Desulfosporosinus sp.]MDA8221395.1 hydrogenase maturation nickel metallochaperone HypA [Desulfitobacterium hafniense]
MHEVSIIQNVIEIVTQKAIENNLTKINKVSLKIGELSGVMPESLKFAFESCIKGTMLEESSLGIEIVSALGECKACNLEFPIEHFHKLCPNCNKFCTSIVSGYELYVNTIEGD